jgi:hypothetical protein
MKPNRIRALLRPLLLAAACGVGTVAAPALAQVGPTPAEAAYQGLHAAAHKGDVAQIARLAAAGPT